MRDVLRIATETDNDRDILAAAQAMRTRASGAPSAGTRNPALARRLNQAASQAFWDRSDAAEALRLQSMSFDANPADAEVAGNLAFFQLKQKPPQPQRARDAALQALTAPGSRNDTGRIEDWTSLAVAEALLGNQTNARAAFRVAAAMPGKLERTCRAALDATATYGEAVRPAASGLLEHVHRVGRSDASRYCQWPPNWAAGKRYP